MGKDDASPGHDQHGAGDPTDRGTGVHHQPEGGSNQRGLAGSVAAGGGFLGPTGVPARVLKATPATGRYARQARPVRRRTKAKARSQVFDLGITRLLVFLPQNKPPARKNPAIAAAWPDYQRGVRGKALYAHIRGYKLFKSRWKRQEAQQRLLAGLRKRAERLKK